MEDQAPEPGFEPANPVGVDSLNVLQCMQACVSNAPVSIFHVSESGNIIEANRQACALLGCARTELVKMTVFDIDLAMTREWWGEYCEKLTVQGSCKREGACRRKDGSTFPVEVVINNHTVNGAQHFYVFVQDITERKKNEEALNASEKRFRTLYEASFEGVALTEQGKFVDLNEQLARMLGYTRDELLGSAVIACVAPQDRQMVTNFIMSGSTEPYEHIALRKDGSQFPVLVRAKNVLIDGKEMRVSVIQDISQQKQAEENNKRLVRLESEALQVARLGYWEYDVAGKHFTFNDQYYALHGTNAKQAGGYQISAQDFVQNYVHPDDAPLLEDAFQRAEKTSDPKFHFQIDVQLLKTNGEVIDVAVWFRIEKDGSGETVKLFGVTQDITERKQVETALRESEFFLRKSQDVGGLGSYYFNVTSGTWISSEKLDQIFGIDDAYPKTVEGWIDLIHPDDQAMMLEHLTEHVIAQHNRFNKEYRTIRHNDGEVRWVHGMGELEFDQAGNTQRMIGTIQDITRRKQDEEALLKSEAQVRQLNEELEKRVHERTAQLQNANKELEAFAYSVSHDLRAPLRAVNGYTRILMEDYESVLDAEGKRICEVISAEGSRMGQLIDDLLEFSRLGRTEMQHRPVDMNALVTSTFRDLTAAENMSRINFYKEKLPVIEGDPRLLRQVWANLLSNALKFSHNCPIATIEVGCLQEQDKLIFWVRDNGAGFDMRYQDKLFGVFQRLHSINEFEGTGVGLAIVQRIIHRHGGEVWADGKVGQGATFSFSLPKKGDTP